MQRNTMPYEIVQVMSKCISTGSKNHSSNPHAQKEDVDNESTIHFNKCERITNLVAHFTYEYYFKNKKKFGA